MVVPSPATRQSKSVALVDDDVSLCRSMARFLRASGYEVCAYQSAEDFLCREDSKVFDCLILDIQLGRMSGLELCEHLTALGHTTPVVFITAYDDAEKCGRASRAGCAGYLNKSEPGEKVLRVIAEAIARARRCLSELSQSPSS